MLRTTIAVFGAGGVGGYFGAVLARAGYPVVFIARGPHLEAIRKDGLHIRSPKGDFNITPAKVTENPADVGPVEAVLLGVKAWQVPEAARAIRPLLAPTTKVLPLQNGVETADQLQQVLGPQHTLVGLCRIISSVTAPGHIFHAGVEPTIALGEPDGSVLSAKGQTLADDLRAAGVVVETPSDIRAALWAKLVLIAAVSGAGAVTRATIGEVRECLPARQLLSQLMEEVVAVAHARGIRLAEDVIPRTLAFVESLPAGGTASMQRDIDAGRRSELEEIIGAVVRLGDQRGVSTPTMDCVYASLLPQELRARNPRTVTVPSFDSSGPDSTGLPKEARFIRNRCQGMSENVNHLGQPIGFVVRDWRERPRPRRTAMQGRFCRVESLDPERHAADLHAANREDKEGRMWSYLAYGPFSSFEDYLAKMNELWLKEDWHIHAIIDEKSGLASGLASYMHVEPIAGSIEVGAIMYSPRLQRTTAGTEAMYLMMKRAFDELGYRRYEWRCNSLNEGSAKAAKRLGFQFEGIFRQAHVIKGRNRDTAWFSIIDREWPQMQAAFEAWLAPENFDSKGGQRQTLTQIRNQRL